MTSYLMDADTATRIDKATEAQVEASIDPRLGEEGIFLIDADGTPVDESQASQPWVSRPVRPVYVEGA